MARSNFIVLGAGPTGVGTAYVLASRGFSVTVIERGQAVGGLAGSFEFGGQSVDYGSHRLHSSTPPAIMSVVQSMLGEELQLRPRHGRVLLDGRWIEFPLSPADLVRSMPPRFLTSAARSALAATFRRRSDATFSEYVNTGLGRTMGDAFYFPYARKIWGIEPSELSGVQARKRISADSPLKLLARVFAGGNSDRRFFYYPAGGFGRIVEVISEAAIGAGAEFHTGTAAASVDLTGPSPVVTTTTGARFDADQVLSTIPLTTLARIATPIEQETLDAADRLEFRSMILVYLSLPTDRFSQFDAHYFPSADVPVTRISEPKNYRSGPDSVDGTVLCAEIPCSPEDEIWAWSEEDLGRLVGDVMVRTGLGDPTPREVTVRRVRHAYPIYRVGLESSLDAVLEWSLADSCLVTLGRQGLFAHDNTHHALSMAWAVGDAVDDHGVFSTERWADALQDFQEHVVED